MIAPATTGVVAPGRLFEGNEGLHESDPVEACGIVDAIFRLFGEEAAGAYTRLHVGIDTPEARRGMNTGVADWTTLRNFGEWWRKERGL